MESNIVEAQADRERAAGEQTAKSTRSATETSSQSSHRYALWAVGGLLLVAVVLRTFVVERLTLEDAGMEPYLKQNSTYWLYRLAYSSTEDIAVGDIVAIDAEAIGAPYETLLWRVIALPGDAVEIAPGRPVMINGETTDPAVDTHPGITHPWSSESIPQDHVFVVAAKCCSQWDSYGVGPIPFSAIRGKIID